MKKFAVLFLSFVLIFCFFAPIFAEEEPVDCRKIAEDKVLEVLNRMPKWLDKEVEDLSRLRAVAYPAIYINEASPKRYRDVNLNPTLEESSEVPLSMLCIVYDGDEPVYQRTVKIRGDIVAVQHANSSEPKYYYDDEIKQVKEKFGVKDEDIVFVSTLEGSYVSIDDSGKSIYRIGANRFGCKDVPLMEKKYSYKQLRKGSVLINDFLMKGRSLNTSDCTGHCIDDYISTYTAFLIHLSAAAIAFVVLILAVIFEIAAHHKKGV